MTGNSRRWLIAAAAAMVAAVPVSSAAIRLAGLERATWVRVLLGPGSPTAPPLRLVYGDRSVDPLPVLWESETRSTLLGLHSTAPVRLLAIDTDRGVVPPWLAQTWAPLWERQSAPPALRLDGTGVVDALGAFQRFTLTFEPAAATVAIGWLDLRETLRLSAGGAPSSITLTRPTARRGWVLLPATPIDRLAIRRDAGTAAFTLAEVSVRGAREQRWAGGVAAGGAPNGIPQCAAVEEGSGLRVEASPAACEVALAGVGPINRVSFAVRALVWLVAAATGLLILWALALSAARLRSLTSRYTLVESVSGRWLRERTTGWTRARVLAAVVGISLAYHLSYLLAVPPHFNFDSLGYYAFGRNLLYTRSLAAVGTCRTPGYPAALALSVLPFGDQLHAIVAIQHLALCALGGLVAWWLFSKVGPVWAAVAGLFAGVSPIMSLAANIVWTETLFLVSATLGLLVFAVFEDRPRRFLGAGILAGCATLIRPNGVVIPGLIVVWLFMRWWCGRPGGAQVRGWIQSAALLVAGFAAVTMVWVVHFHRATGTWGLSDASCSLDQETHPPVAAGLHPTDIFQLAAFTNLISQSEDVPALPVTEPHRAFFEFFPARHRYYVGRFLPPELTYDDRFPGEAFREYIRHFPGTYLRQVRDALVFNLTHVQRTDASIFAYPDLDAAIAALRQRAGGAAAPDARVASLERARTLTWPEADVLLGHMAAWKPVWPRLRLAHLRVNAVAMSLWGLPAALGLLGGALCLFIPGYRAYSVLAAHALVLAAAPAVLGMAADRYAMAAEPAFYIVAAIGLSVVTRWRVARVGTS